MWSNFSACDMFHCDYHCRHCRLSIVHWRRNCFADRTTTHTSGNSSILIRDIYCGPEVLFETCVAIKFVDDDDDDDDDDDGDDSNVTRIRLWLQFIASYAAFQQYLIWSQEVYGKLRKLWIGKTALGLVLSYPTDVWIPCIAVNRSMLQGVERGNRTWHFTCKLLTSGCIHTSSVGGKLFLGLFSAQHTTCYNYCIIRQYIMHDAPCNIQINISQRWKLSVHRPPRARESLCRVGCGRCAYFRG